MTFPWTAATSDASEILGQSLRALVPVLTTERLRLRAPERSDFPVWQDILCGPRAEHIGGAETPEEAWFDFCLNTANWMLRGHGMWTVTDRAGTVLGFVMLGFEPGDQEHELGFLFAEAAEGKGHAAEAARAARDFAFGTLGVPSLVSYVTDGNDRSTRLAERLGARRDPEAEAALGDPDLTVWRHGSPEVKP